MKNRNFVLSSLALAALFGACKPSRTVGGGGSGVLAWGVEEGKNWTEADEAEFSRWITAIGDGRVAKKCKFLSDCIKNPEVNFLRTAEDDGIGMHPDCADVPGTLRAYFAYKKKLPFMFVFEIKGKVDERNDMRYATEIVPTRVMNQTSIKTLNDLFERIRLVVSSAFYRMSPEVEGNDTFPVRVSRDAIRPGTVYYDSAGHVMMVYKVDPDGTVRFIQGHPGDEKAGAYFTIAMLSSKEHNRASSRSGGGFRNWRGYTYEGGKLKFRSNAEEPSFSGTEQFQNTFPAANGGTTNYFEYVRTKLCMPGQCGISPALVANKFQKICSDITERVDAVDAATSLGIHKKPHPGIPSNVYSAPPDRKEWEDTSSPSRDTRLRGAYAEANEMIVNLVGMAARRDPNLAYTGTPAALVGVFQKYWNEALANPACRYKFAGSDGKPVAFTIGDVDQRLFDLSFDPYHCPELRWGIQNSPACVMDANKMDAYRREAGIRNITDADKRPPGGPDQLNQGAATPPVIGISRLLSALAANPPAQVAVGSTVSVARPVVAPVVVPPPVVAAPVCEKLVVNVYGAYAYPSAKVDEANFITQLSKGDVLAKLSESAAFYYVSSGTGGASAAPLYGAKAYVQKSAVRCQ
jgi:hypothetical protein